MLMQRLHSAPPSVDASTTQRTHTARTTTPITARTHGHSSTGTAITSVA